MKTMSAALVAHYASDQTTIATLWHVTRRDGKVFAFTDHDVPITFPPDSSGIEYQPTSVYDPGTFKTSNQMNVDDVSVTGLLAIDAITAEGIEAGQWDGAKVEIMEVNYEDLSMGENVLRFGDIGQIQRNGPVFTAELRGLMQYLQNNIGDLVNATCPYDLGDSKCRVDLEALRVSGTVSASTSTRSFTAAAMGQDADYFRFGVVRWTAGANEDLEMEVKAFAAGGVFELQLDMPFAIAAGDAFSVVPGCSKIGRGGDCKLKFDNYLNFGGFEDVPGQNQVLLVGGQ